MGTTVDFNKVLRIYHSQKDWTVSREMRFQGTFFTNVVYSILQVIRHNFLNS